MASKAKSSGPEPDNIHDEHRSHSLARFRVNGLSAERDVTEDKTMQQQEWDSSQRRACC